MKSVLLISSFFAPQNAVGAVRPTKLAKYLARMGYGVTVLCRAPAETLRDPLLARDLEELADVRMVKERSLLRLIKQNKAAGGSARSGGAAAASPPPNRSPKLKKSAAADALYLWLTQRADAAFGRACRRELRAMGRRFDVVISTYGPFSVHKVARWARRRGVAGRWIADFRDEVTVPFRLQQRRVPRAIRQVRSGADAVTAVSAGCLKVMGLADTGVVIYNGFDSEDLRELAFPPKRSDRLTFVHCGQMYGARRDLSPFFRALRELADEGAVDEARIELAHAGRDTGGFAAQAEAAGLGACLRDYGYLPRDEALRLQLSAHILLLAAWNERERQGNVPGKLLEYLMLSMPVLCCVSGPVPDSEAAGILRRTRAGVCCEQADAANGHVRLKEYIKTQYDRFTRGEPMLFAPDAEATAAFGSSRMAEAFAHVVESL
jgi:glycosyltransferase involved in cell wall biosynthesis